jgi:hypothetical protein
MNGHAITAWVAVLYRRIGGEGERNETGLLKARRSKLSVYCIGFACKIVAAIVGGMIVWYGFYVWA